MNRRAFFKRSIKKATQTSVKYADNKATKNASQWIRPPYAINELEFLLACTRCGDCISACEYEVIFPLPANYGGTAVKTPAMDLLNKGCHLCADWPCVTACKPAALEYPAIPVQVDSEQITANQKESNHVDLDRAMTAPPPKMAMARIVTDSCLPYLGPECGACRSICQIEGALSWDLTKPVINPDLCCGCGLCRQACITEPRSITIHNLHQMKGDST